MDIREPFFQRRNPPRPLATRFFSVEVLRDPSPGIFSALECSATPRGPFFQRGSPPRPLAEPFRPTKSAPFRPKTPNY